MTVPVSSGMRTLSGYLAMLRRWLWFLALCTVLGAMSAFVVSWAQKPVYRAEAVMVVNQSGTGQDIYNGVLASDQLATTYANLATERIVLENASDRVGGISAAGLAAEVHASADAGAPVVRIQVDDHSPGRAAALANAVASALADVLTEHGLGAGTANGPVQVFQPAIPPTSPAQPRPLLSAAAAAALSLALAASLILLLELMDDRIRVPEQVEPTVGAPLIGLVETLPAAELPRPTTKDSALVTSFQELRHNLTFIGCERPLHVIAVASAGCSEGKSTVAINLARTLVDGGARVVLIDANFRHPTIHTALRIPNTSGLSGLLLDFGEIDALSPRYGTALAAVPDVPGLRVLTTGPIPPNPAELLGSARMDQLLRAILAGSLGNGYTDVIVLDTAPVTLYPETAALACRVDALDSLLLVVDRTRSRRRALSRVRDCLAGAESKLIGAVFNRGTVRPSRKPYPPAGDDEASAIDGHAEQHPLLVTEIAGGDDARQRLLQDEGDDVPQSRPHIASGNRAEWSGEISV